MKLQHVQAGSGAGTVAIQICSSPSALEQPSRLPPTLLRILLGLFDHLKARHSLALTATFEAIRLRCAAGSRHQLIEQASTLEEEQPAR